MPKMNLTQNIKDNAGAIITMMLIIIWIALAEMGYGWYVLWFVIIATLAGIAINWKFIIASLKYGFDLGQRLRQSNEVKKDIKEALKDGNEERQM